LSAKPVEPSALAREDAAAAVLYYSVEVDIETGVRFADAIQTAYRQIADAPKLGSPGYAQRLNIPGLRTRKLARFPYLVFYRELEDRIDIVRILHNARDIPAWLASADD
jgi:toxin ParE1/3/4